MAIVLEGRKGQKSVAEICPEHQISQTVFDRWRDRFLESGQQGLTNGAVGDETEALRAQIEKLEKIIGRQTIAIEALKRTHMTKFLLGPPGWCYLIIVPDLYTREIVGWNLSLRANTSERKEAMDRALCEKFP